jgi:hypothetical protein
MAVLISPNFPQELNTGMKRSGVLTFQMDQRQGYSQPDTLNYSIIQENRK